MVLNMMPKEMTQTVLNFQKVAMDTTFKTVSLAQDQAENMVDTFLGQGVHWLPKEGQSIFKEWTSVYKKTRDDYKKSLDSCFDQFESMMKNSK